MCPTKFLRKLLHICLSSFFFFIVMIKVSDDIEEERKQDNHMYIIILILRRRQKYDKIKFAALWNRHNKNAVLFSRCICHTTMTFILNNNRKKNERKFVRLSHHNFMLSNHKRALNWSFIILLQMLNINLLLMTVIRRCFEVSHKIMTTA